MFKHSSISVQISSGLVFVNPGLQEQWKLPGTFTQFSQKAGSYAIHVICHLIAWQAFESEAAGSVYTRVTRLVDANTFVNILTGAFTGYPKAVITVAFETPSCVKASLAWKIRVITLVHFKALRLLIVQNKSTVRHKCSFRCC